MVIRYNHNHQHHLMCIKIMQTNSGGVLRTVAIIRVPYLDVLGTQTWVYISVTTRGYIGITTPIPVQNLLSPKSEILKLCQIKLVPP